MKNQKEFFKTDVSEEKKKKEADALKKKGNEFF